MPACTNTVSYSSPKRSRVRTGCVQRYSALAGVLFFWHSVAPAHAFELGELRVHSWLGRQLKASIALAGDDARAVEGRCFRATLQNLQHETVGSLKVTLQHSTKQSLLLLAGGNAVEEPAAMIVVEHVCGDGVRREYALLLDAAPPSAGPLVEHAMHTEPQPAPVTNELARVPRRKATPVHVAEAPVDPLSELTVPMNETWRMKLAARLVPRAAQDGTVRVAWASSPPGPLALRTERTLASAARMEEGPGTKALAAVALSILAVAGALAWLAWRVRAMQKAARPWVPVDELLDPAPDEEERTQRPGS